MAEWSANHDRFGEAAWWLGELLTLADEATAQPVDAQDEAEVAYVQALHGEMLQRAEAVGQAVAPPGDFPADDLAPECDRR
jgi:hypothetical protein